MAEQKLWRAVVGGAEREWKRKQACGGPHLDAKLRGGLNSAGNQRNGGAAQSSELNNGAAAVARVCEAKTAAAVDAGQGKRASLYIVVAKGLGVRAQAREEACPGRTRARVHAVHGKETPPTGGVHLAVTAREGRR